MAPTHAGFEKRHGGGAVIAWKQVTDFAEALESSIRTTRMEPATGTRMGMPEADGLVGRALLAGS